MVHVTETEITLFCNTWVLFATNKSFCRNSQLYTFLAQLQNQFFVEHLPVAAYVLCLKEKEWK